jgi:hypothetical protein
MRRHVVNSQYLMNQVPGGHTSGRKGDDECFLSVDLGPEAPEEATSGLLVEESIITDGEEVIERTSEIVRGIAKDEDKSSAVLDEGSREGSTLHPAIFECGTLLPVSPWGVNWERIMFTPPGVDWTLRGLPA